jgi:predicted porin
MKRVIFTTLLGVCAALPALSADLEFSAAGEVEYDDNVFRTDRHKEDDELFRLYPGIRVYEDHGDDVNYSIGYTAPVELSVENGSEFNEVDHVGDGRLVYHANERFEFFVNDRYSYIRSTLRTQTNTDAFAVVENVPEITDRRDRVKTNDGSLGATYHFSPRTTATGRATTGFFDSSRSDRSRVWTAGATADLDHRLTLKHQIGAGAGYTFQDFGEREDIQGSQTNTYRVYGTWRWTITPTLAFDLNAGPAYLETKQDDASTSRLTPSFPFALLGAQEVPPGFFDQFGNPKGGVVGSGSLLVATIANCGSVNGIQVAAGCGGNILLDSTGDGSGTPTADQNAITTVLGSTTNVVNVDPHGQHDRDLTGFVDATLTQRWSPNLATALHYTRQQGDGSGLGGTVIEDVVSLANTWDFAERWQLYFRGDYVRRESAFDLSQSYDAVTGQILSPGGLPIAVRTGTAFNSKRNVEVDTENWRIGGRITHQLFKSTSVYVQLNYEQQDSKNTSLGASSDYTNFLATFGVRHVFEPIPLW